MRHLKTIVFAGLCSLLINQAYATPDYLVTHNKTDVESNAYIAGIASVYPVKPNSERSISWYLVRLACWGHATNDICEAEIFMDTKSKKPVSVGIMKMNLKTGEITPKQSSKNGYCATVSGPGETTLTKGDC